MSPADIIPFDSINNFDASPVTGILLVDAEPGVMACLLRRESWETRAKLFSMAFDESLAIVAARLDYVIGEEDKERYAEWAHLRCMRVIAETLHELNEEVPREAAAAMLFLLSLDPMHRRAARNWCKTHLGTPASASFFRSEAAQRWRVLCRYHNTVALTRPGTGEAWRNGIADPPLFRDESVAP